MFRAWELFRRGKRARRDVMMFERHLEVNLFELRDELRSQTYRHSTYEPFVVHDPKRRQIHKASVRDRVVHQLVVSAIEPLFDTRFIYDSYSCRQGKGTHAAVRRLHQFLAAASQHDRRPVYALKCDVRQFFASVDHTRLLDLLARRVNDETTTWLLQIIIDSFALSPGKGIPLGNLTSQLFANVYLNELDRFAKHTLREGYYLRYCDDFVILSADRQHLLELVAPLSRFLEEQLGLALHPGKVTVRGWRQGIDFLGYVLKPGCTLLRTKTKRRMLARVDRTNVSSYLGLCSHADSYELQQLIHTKV